MRILSLGQGIPDAVVDNFNWASALSFYDYDAMIVDPSAGVSQVIESILRGEGEYQTYDDVPVLDGPSSSDSVGLSDLLRRRRDETEQLLARGGLVVCFGYPDVPHPRVGGFTGAHRYYWLPAPTGCDFSSSYVKAASGRHLSVVDWEHPFANFLDARRNDILYRASFAEGAQGFPGAHVIARSNGGTAIAIEVPVGGGRVIFAPAPPQHPTNVERSRFASDLVAAIRNALLTSAEGDAPEWLEDEKLPGLEEARRSMEDAEARLDELEAELDQARNQFRGIDRYRRILWQEGKYGYELPVRDALALLGFSQYSTPDLPATVSYRSDIAFVEAESSSGAVGMDPHYRLRARIEAKIADDGTSPPHGIIVVNGFREIAPGEREQ
ncbi:MAG TPA: hypothetical protein VFY10_01645, partial [Dehalococcoidia bacterium]|nr:hypothetical protein [Dehalococcoidia bacterium]